MKIIVMTCFQSKSIIAAQTLLVRSDKHTHTHNSLAMHGDGCAPNTLASNSNTKPRTKYFQSVFRRNRMLSLLTNRTLMYLPKIEQFMQP